MTVTLIGILMIFLMMMIDIHLGLGQLFALVFDLYEVKLIVILLLEMFRRDGLA